MTAVVTQETLAQRGGFFRDASSVAERALRSIKRDPEVTVPALFIPVFMYIMTVWGAERHRRGHPRPKLPCLPDPCGGSFRCDGDISRPGGSHRHSDRLLRPVGGQPSEPAGITLGADDCRLCAGRRPHRPGYHHVLCRRCKFRHRHSRDSVVHVPQWTLGTDLHRLSLCHRPEDRQPCRGQHQLLDLLSPFCLLPPCSCPKRR